MIPKILRQIRNQYVIHQVRRIALPKFPEEPLCRCRVTFSGRVQKVGFRLEVQELAARLGLTGFCRNLPNGDVLAELQGGQSRIQFLISFLESLIRIRIDRRVLEEIPVCPQESGFQRQ